MYEPRKPNIRRPLKKRSAKFVLMPLASSSFWQTNGWMSLVTLGGTIVPPRVVPRIFTYIKKLTKYPKTRSRFWVNAQCSYLVTRKPLNVRMGKGKGAKVRLYSKIGGGVPLAAVARLRDGLKKRLQRFISIRLGRRVVTVTPPSVTSKVEWAQRHRTQINFLKGRAEEVKTLLTFIRKPSLKVFFGRLFRAAWRKPRLRWRFRWPLLPKISSKLKARRRKWGSGLKISAPIWAGLGSLMAGVRRTRTKGSKFKSFRLLRIEGKIFKLFSKKKRHILKVFKSKGEGSRLRKIRAVKVFLNFRCKAFYKSLRLRGLRGIRKTNPHSTMETPNFSSLVPLRSIWSAFFFNLSDKEAFSLESTKAPSLSLALKTISIIEKSSLIICGTTVQPHKSQEPYLGGSLFLINRGVEENQEGSEPIDCSSLILSYIVEDGFVELWPRFNLRPFALTQITLSPLLTSYL